MPNLQAYRAIRAKVDETGWPHPGYRNDVTYYMQHFFKRLQAPAVFGLALSKTAARLFLPLDPVGRRHAAAIEAVGRALYPGKVLVHWFWYDGSELKEVAYEQMVEELEATSREAQAYRDAHME